MGSHGLTEDPLSGADPEARLPQGGLPQQSWMVDRETRASHPRVCAPPAGRHHTATRGAGLGHSSISTTFDICTHVVDASHRKAVERLKSGLARWTVLD